MHNRLRRARLLAGFNNAKAAVVRFGWKASTYRAHENGQNKFGAVDASAYARAFKVSSSWLLFGEQGPPDLTAKRPGTAIGADPCDRVLTGCMPPAGSPTQRGHFDLSLDTDDLDDIGCQGDILRFAPIQDYRSLLDGDIVAVERLTDYGVDILPVRVFFRHGQALFAARPAARTMTLANARILGKAIWLLRPLG